MATRAARCSWFHVVGCLCAAALGAAGTGCGEASVDSATCVDPHCPRFVRTSNLEDAYCVVGEAQGTQCDTTRPCQRGTQCVDISTRRLCASNGTSVGTTCVCEVADEWRAAGLWYALGAGVLSGVMYMPFYLTRQLDNCDDPLCNFFMCAGFFVLSTGGSWWRSAAGVYPIAALGGMAVSVAHLFIPMAARLLPPPVAMAIWALVSLVVTWVTGFFGFTDLPAAGLDASVGLQVLLPGHSFAGMVLTAVGLGVLGAVDMQFGTRPEGVSPVSIDSKEVPTPSPASGEGGGATPNGGHLYLRSAPRPITATGREPAGVQTLVTPVSSYRTTSRRGIREHGLDLADSVQSTNLPVHFTHSKALPVPAAAAGSTPSGDEATPLMVDSFVHSSSPQLSATWTGVWNAIDKESSRRGLDRDPREAASAGGGSFRAFLEHTGEELSCAGGDHPWLVGTAVSIVCGAVHGLYLLPVVLCVVNADAWTTQSPSFVRFSHAGIDYAPSLAHGFLAGAVVQLCGVVYGKCDHADYLNIPGILGPALAAGVVWGCGQALLLEAASRASLAAVICIYTPTSAVVASVWKALCFRESFAANARNKWFLAAAVVLGGSGAALAALSVLHA